MATKAFEKLVLTEAAIRFKQLSKSPSFTNPEFDSGDKQAIIQSLFEEFKHIHDFLFQDSSVHHKVSPDGKVHNSRDLNEAQNTIILHGITRFVTSLYDENGNIKEVDNLATVILDFINASKDFALHNSDFVCGALLCKLAKSDKFKTITPHGIDFARATTAGLSEQAVQQALSDKTFQIEDTSTYPTLPSTMIEKDGHKYLGYKIGDRTYIISETGYLIDDGRHISDVLVIPENASEEEKQFLTALKTRLSAMENSAVDNDLAEKQKPLDMEVDRLTGLNQTELKEFKNTYKYSRYSDLLRNNEGKFASTLAEATQNITAKIAEYPGNVKLRLIGFLPIIWGYVEKQFEGKTPQQSNTKFYMLQGGTGSGKSNLIAKAKAECKDNVVIASLDDSREISQLYDLYVASNNHADDYAAFTELGNAVRDTIIEKAKRDRYNLIIDGSGIPYAQRNDSIVKNFNDDGYRTNLFAATAYLKAKAQNTTDNSTPAQIRDAITNAQERLVKHHRAVPWSIIQKKHVGFPLAHMEAVTDANFDNIVLWDHTDTFTNAPVLAFTTAKTFSQNEIEEFSKFIANGNGAEFLKALKQAGALPEELNHEQNIDPKLVDFKAVKEITTGQYRLQVILNMDHFQRMQVRGLFNAEAKGSNALFANTIACDVQGIYRGDNGSLKLPYTTQTNSLEDSTIAGAQQQGTGPSAP